MVDRILLRVLEICFVLIIWMDIMICIYIYIYGYRYMGYSDYWIIWMSNPPCFISAEMPVCVVGKL